MSTETESSNQSENREQGSAGLTSPDLMGELKKAEMRAEAYSHLDDPLGANQEAVKQNRERAEQIRQQLAAQHQGEQHQDEQHQVAPEHPGEQREAA